MCGIAGLVEAPGSAVDEGALVAMGDALLHRGPDEGRTWKGAGALAHVGLSHRRLSILDHEGGRQPMSSADGRVTVCFNGQIYNHLALRAELVATGHSFRSDHADTEVLVHGARAWRAEGEAPGVGLCSRLSGMFAFAIVDEERRTLTLARDPIGKKPLYVAGPSFFEDRRPRLAFASELAALEALPGARCAVDVAAVARYLAFDFVPDPDCIYQGVFKLEPGHVLEIPLHDAGSWSDLPSRARPFRELSFHRAALPDGHRARVEELRGRIERAVATRLVADVPVGVFLSGGLDSSLVAALAARRSTRVETFSIAFREPSYDESAWSRRVSAHIGSRHHEELLDEPALLEVLPRIVGHLAEPFGDHSIIPTWLLSRFARERVTVALGGDGGDELFLGYPTFLVEAARPALADRAADPLQRVAALALSAARRLPVSHADFAFDFKVTRTLDGVAEPRALRRHQLFLTGATDARLRMLLSAPARHELERQHPGDLLASLDVLEARARAAGARDVFDALQLGYAKTYLAAGVLQKVDRASMASSLEVRAPLLDNAVVDYGLALPSSDKLRRFQTKAILKDVARGLLPDDVIDRKKKGFGVPVAAWLAGPLSPLVGDMLSTAALGGDELLDGAVVGKLADEHLSRRANHRKILWALLMLQLWRKRTRSARAAA
jgi:asparagine synthase (glutamine-hydrolysing)